MVIRDTFSLSFQDGTPFPLDFSVYPLANLWDWSWASFTVPLCTIESSVLDIQKRSKLMLIPKLILSIWYIGSDLVWFSWAEMAYSSPKPVDSGSLVYRGVSLFLVHHCKSSASIRPGHTVQMQKIFIE